MDWVGRTKGDVKVTTFLVGYKIKEGNPVSLFVETKGFSNNVAKVALTAGENNQVELIRLCLIYSSHDKSFVSETLVNKANAEHPWLKATGERLVDAVQ